METAYLAIAVGAGTFVLYRFGVVRGLGLLPVLQKKNFRGERILGVAGVLFPVQLTLVMLGYSLWTGWGSVPYGEAQLLAVYLLGGVGLVDDIWGSSGYKGFKGHWRALVKDRVFTTGCLKAVGGAFVAAVLAIHIGGTWLQVLLHFWIIVLSVNVMNLLDLRPGRALKAFGVWSLLILIAGGVDGRLWFPVLAAVLVMLPDDLKGRIMLGDTGANSLGGLIGLWICLGAPLGLKLLFLTLFVCMQGYAEHGSLGAFIEKHRWLRKWDAWGRS